MSKNVDGQQQSAMARDFSARLQGRAAELRISRGNLQAWTDSKKQTFAGYWNGERLPPADLLLRLSEELDVSPRWLLFGEGESPSSSRITSSKAPRSRAAALGIDSTERDSSPMIVEKIATRVRARASELGIEAPLLQKGLGIPSSSFENYWKGKRIWPTEVLGDLAEKLQTSVDSILGANTESSLDLVSVNEIDLAYGLGGTYADGLIESQILHFPRTWLESITSTPAASLTFARGRGDSMQPTLQDGDIVLIDRSVQRIREQDAIWALTIGDIAMIKRVRVKGDTVALLSDNDRVPDDQVHVEELNIVGRVVFIGRRL